MFDLIGKFFTIIFKGKEASLAKQAPGDVYHALRAQRQTQLGEEVPAFC